MSTMKGIKRCANIALGTAHFLLPWEIAAIARTQLNATTATSTIRQCFEHRLSLPYDFVFEKLAVLYDSAPQFILAIIDCFSGETVGNRGKLLAKTRILFYAVYEETYYNPSFFFLA